jgi:hypothetical protein
VRLRDEGLAVPGWHWVQFSAGLPLLFSALFRVFPHGVGAVARVATATATGLLGLLPFLIWRPILAYRWRLLAGLLLALWPGQVFFSGVAAQENWVLLPTVALAALSVRRLRDPRDGGHPVAAGLLLCAAAAIRQEMLPVLLLPALAAAGLPGRGLGRAARFAAAAAIPLLLLAAERRAATGRFAITTEHGGLSLLGTLVPGSAAAGWLDPTLFLASADPSLLKDPGRLRRTSWALAAGEAGRRHRFHAFRVAVSALRLSVESDAQNLFWSLEAPGALSPLRAPAGAAWARVARPLLRLELASISGLFLAALALGIRRRDAGILVLSAAVAVKILVQVLFSPLGRLMVPAIALELLVVALAAANLGEPGAPREGVAFGVLALLAAALLFAAVPPLERLAIAKDERPPTVSRFPLAIAGGGGWAECAVEDGRVTALAGDRAWIGPRSGGNLARVGCRLPALADCGTLGLDFEDREGIDVRATVEGEAFSGRAPLPGGGWLRAPLCHDAASRAPERVGVEVRAPAGVGAAGFGFERVNPDRPALPRYRALP